MAKNHLTTMIDFLKGSVLAGIMIVALAAIIHSCDQQNRNDVVKQRMREQCMIQCHPNKSQYVDTDETCLCDVQL